MQRLISRAALLLVLVACSKPADTPPAASGPMLPDGRVPAALVEALDSTTMAAMEQRTGDWSEADASSRWRAMASNGAIRVIDETMAAGESSTRRITHYYTDSGAVAAYIEFRIQTITAGDRPPAKQFVLMKLEFAGDSTLHSEKTVDGVAQPVEPFEVANARKHSLQLFAAAHTAAVSKPAQQ